MEMPEVRMKKGTPNINKVLPAEILEGILNSLPRKELPSYVEARVLAAVHPVQSKTIMAISRPKQAFQWAALSMAACVFAMLGALMACWVNPASHPGTQTSEHHVDIYDPGLLDYFIE